MADGNTQRPEGEPQDEQDITPDEVALAAFQGILANPAFAENYTAAGMHAWAAVMSYYQGREWFAEMSTKLNAAAQGG